MDIRTLVKLTSRAWSLRILSLMHRGTPGRQSSLIMASGAGRTAFTQSLTHLIDLGLLERNPGHGHPLRPEYRLTAKGITLAAIADRIEGAIPQPGKPDLLRRTWAIPILAVSQKPLYFIDIKKALVTITDRALSQSLKQLHGEHWLERKIVTTMHPPRPLYQATDIGAQIAQAIGLGHGLTKDI